MRGGSSAFGLVDLARYGRADDVQALLRARPPGEQACTRALLALAQSVHPSAAVAQLLVDAGANVNARDPANHWDHGEGCTPLHHLAASRDATGAAGVIKVLLAAGANTAAITGFDSQPLHLWAKHGRTLEVAELLLGAGAETDTEDICGRTPLHLAAARDDDAAAAAVKWLLEAASCRATAITRHGQTPLHCWARRSLLPKVGELLIAAGADKDLVLARKDYDGMTPLHLAACSWGNDAAAAIKMLLAAGTDVGVAGFAGRTPLAHACRSAAASLKCSATAPREVVDTVLLLLERGAPGDDTQFARLLAAAVRKCRTDVVERLLAAATFPADTLVDAARGEMRADWPNPDDSPGRTSGSVHDEEDCSGQEQRRRRRRRRKSFNNAAVRLVLAQLLKQDLPRLLQELGEQGRLSAVPARALHGVVSALADETELGRQLVELAQQREANERERGELRRQRRDVQQLVAVAAGPRAAALERGQASMDRFVTKRPRAAAAAAANN